MITLECNPNYRQCYARCPSMNLKVKLVARLDLGSETDNKKDCPAYKPRMEG